jgi:serine/threonine protein kinase
MADAPQPENLSGKHFGGYEILNLIGHGGMATVYRARQTSMNRVVALKVLPRIFIQDDTYIQRFNREVEIVSQLEHRSIVPVHDHGALEGQPYIVMRYMPAGSVDDRLASGPLDSENTLRIIEEIAPALDYAHGKGVLHRDLKPSNILLDDNGDAYLTDFGIARMLGENQGGISITTRNVVGTPAYMSPEQAQGKPLDARSDLYGLGVMLFEMVTGQRPFQAETPYGVAVLQVTAPTPSACAINPALSFRVEEVINRAMHKNPEQRYKSAEALANFHRSITVCIYFHNSF